MSRTAYVLVYRAIILSVQYRPTKTINNVRLTFSGTLRKNDSENVLSGERHTKPYILANAQVYEYG